MTFKPGRRTLIVAAVALVAVVAGGIAWASIPYSGASTGCYTKNGGALRVIDTQTTNCTNREQRLDWNVQGAQGTQGPQGQQGAQGPQGQQGPQGVSGWVMVKFETTVHPDTDLGNSVNCPAGKKVLGGGITKQIIGDSMVMESGPKDDGSGWFVLMDNREDFDEPMTFWAICANA